MNNAFYFSNLQFELEDAISASFLPTFSQLNTHKGITIITPTGKDN